MLGLGVVVGDPLRIVCELGEAPFELPIFAELVRAVRDLHQIGILDRLRAILPDGEHDRAFLWQGIPS